MLSGTVAAVPSLGWVGGALLVGSWVGPAWWCQPGRTGAALGLSLALGIAPIAEAQTVSVPHTLSNGSVADADAVNENFEAARTRGERGVELGGRDRPDFPVT